MRVFIVAVALSLLAFLVGLAGDLSNAAAPVTSGQSVTLRIPPPLPADAPRAAPLALTSAAAAAAPRPPTPNRAAPAIESKAESEPPLARAAKPQAARMRLAEAAKPDEDLLAKAKRRKLG